MARDRRDGRVVGVDPGEVHSVTHDVNAAASAAGAPTAPVGTTLDRQTAGQQFMYT